MNDQRISVILAVLNASKTLERCIESVLSQSYTNKELIVIDGGSTDETSMILNKYSSRLAHWESKPDRGIYHAWNKGLQSAGGEWICFLGADDYFWDENVFSNLFPYLAEAAALGTKVVYGQAARVDEKGRILKLIGKPWEKIRWLISHGMPLPHTGLMHHRSLFEEHGLFDERFKIAGDYDLLLRELKAGEALHVPGLIVAGWQSGGISDYKFLLGHTEMERARRKNGFSHVSWVWLAVHARGFVRTYWRKWARRHNY